MMENPSNGRVCSRLFVTVEIINKVREPPPLCRPSVSVDEAPLDVIQVMKQAWSEEPDKRPTFEEIFKQVKHCKPLVVAPREHGGDDAPSVSTVQEHHKGEEDQHH